MISRALSATVALVAFSAPALAFHCPADIRAIDNAVAKADLSAKQKEEVMLLRDEGEAKHLAGHHADAVSLLAEAKRIILNNF